MIPTKHPTRTARPRHLRLVPPTVTERSEEPSGGRYLLGIRVDLPRLFGGVSSLGAIPGPTVRVGPSAISRGRVGTAPTAENTRASERAEAARVAFIDAVAMLEHTVHSAWRGLAVATRVCSRLGRVALRAEWDARLERLATS